MKMKGIRMLPVEMRLAFGFDLILFDFLDLKELVCNVLCGIMSEWVCQLVWLLVFGLTAHFHVNLWS
jgi:hypothetical protein